MVIVLQMLSAVLPSFDWPSRHLLLVNTLFGGLFYDLILNMQRSRPLGSRYS